MRWMGLLILVLPGAVALAEDCPVFLPERTLGTPAFVDWQEVSGLVASRSTPGVLWAHADSGNSAQVFAVREDGTLLGSYTLDGAVNVDWEDIALGPGPIPGVDYLYVGDTGNNTLLRTVLTIYRVPEPAVSLAQSPVVSTLTGVDALQVMYPMVLVTNYDAETLLIDPQSADLYLVTKDTIANRDGGVASVFAYPAPQNAGPPVSLTPVTTVDLGLGLPNLAVGGDLAADDTGLLLKTYSQVLYWPRSPGTPLADTLAAFPCALPYDVEIQGEAIAFDADDAGYYTASEKSLLATAQPIRYHPRSNLQVDATSPLQFHAVMGEDVTLGVAATGEPGLSYQWFRGTPAKTGDPIPNADGPELLLAAVQLGDAGDYYCEVTDSDETVTSPVFHVVVDGALPLGTGPVLWALVVSFGALGGLARRRCTT